MRILHLPSNPSDQAGNVVRQLRRLGHEAELWTFGDTPYGFPSDRVIDTSSKSNDLLWHTFLEAIDRFDVFHLHGARSFFPYGWHRFPSFWDLPVLRMLGKKIVVTFRGSDVRLPSAVGAIDPATAALYAETMPDEDSISKRVEIFRTYVDRMLVANPELLFSVPDATVMPRSIDLGQWPATARRSRAHPLIVHAPSSRVTKGTEVILEGLRRLEDEGTRFDLRLLEGVSHEEVRASMAEADVVIDQILVGDHGNISIQAMASSAVAVAHLHSEVVASLKDPPIYRVTATDFVPKMRALIDDVGERTRLASMGRPYVCAHHDAVVVTERHLEVYSGGTRARPDRTFPDWAGFASARHLEVLEEQVSRMKAESVITRATIKRLTAELRKQRNGRGGRARLLRSPRRGIR